MKFELGRSERRAIWVNKRARLMIPDRLPPGFQSYGRSPDFTHMTLPESLQAAHTTKPGTWALLHVLEGKVLYQLESPYIGERVAGAGQTIVIEADVPHHVTFLGPGRLFIEFCRQAVSSQAG